MISIATAVFTRGYHSFEDYHLLIARNRAVSTVLDVKSIPNARCDHYIFHEGNITKSQQDYILDHSGIPLIFISLQKEFIDNYKKIEKMNIEPLVATKKFGFGYRFMCWFWSVGFRDYFKDFDYLFRVDEDVILQHFDISLVLQRLNTGGYVVACVQDDSTSAVEGLNELVLEKYPSRGVSIPVEINIPYTCFFGFSLKFLKDLDLDFLESADVFKGVFAARWGDHVLWKICFNLNGLRVTDSVFKEIQYKHGSHSRLVNSRLDRMLAGISRVKMFIKGAKIGLNG